MGNEKTGKNSGDGSGFRPGTRRYFWKYAFVLFLVVCGIAISLETAVIIYGIHHNWYGTYGYYVDLPTTWKNGVPTYAAVPYDPGKGKPVFTCDINDLSFSFSMQQREFLLGEPIYVNCDGVLNGDGYWLFDWFTLSGSDDLLAIMRDESGQFVEESDFYKHGASGMVIFLKIDRAHPQNVKLFVQRCCGIEHAGKYELYCMFSSSCFGKEESSGNFDDKESLTGSFQPSYLLHEHFPEFLSALRKSDWPIPQQRMYYYRSFSDSYPLKYANLLARFDIVIREGTAEETAEMVNRCMNVDDLNRPVLQKNGYLVSPLFFIRQNCFLQAIERELQSTHALIRSDLYPGLLNNQDPKGVELLLRYCPSFEFMEMETNWTPRAIEHMIAMLGNEDETVWRKALAFLRDFSGKNVVVDSDNKAIETPNREQVLASIPFWEKWWKQCDGKAPLRF